MVKSVSLTEHLFCQGTTPFTHLRKEIPMTFTCILYSFGLWTYGTHLKLTCDHQDQSWAQCSWGLGLWSQKQGSFYIISSLSFHCSPLGYPSIVLLLFSPFPIVLLFSCSIVLLCSFLLCPFLLFISLLFSPIRLFSIVLLIVCTVWAIPYCSTYLLFCLGIYRDPCTVVLPSSNLLGFPLKG